MRFTWTGIVGRFQEIIARTRAVEMAQAVFGFPTSLPDMATLWAALCELLAASPQVANVKSYGAKGDYDPTTGTGTDDSAALAAALAASETIVLDRDRKYQITSELNNSNKQIIWNGSEIYRTDTGAGYVLNAEGTIGAFSNLDSDAAIGQNVVVCAALAASLKEGDMVKIRSDKMFNTSEGIFEGEIHLVQDVSGANIRLSESLESSYATADTARIALITPDRSSHIGQIRIRRATGYATGTLGMRVHLGLKPNFVASVSGAKTSSIVVSDCYKPIVSFMVDNGSSTTASVGYGCSIENATMYGIFKGIALNCRHAANTGATATYGGVSWGNKIEAIGSTLGSTAIFNSHASTGSVEWVNCTGLGGTHTRPDGVTTTASLFNHGARYTTVRNSRAIRCGTIHSLDTSLSATERMEVVDIDGVDMVDCTGAAFNIPAAWTGIIGRLSVWNVRGKGSGLSLAQWTTIEKWSFGNFDLVDSGVGVTNTLFRVAGTGACPATFEMTNGNFEGPALPTSLNTSDRGASIANTNVTEVIWTGRMTKKSIGLRLESALTRLKLDVDFDQNWIHVHGTASLASVPQEIWLQGGSFRRSQNATATFGAIALAVAGGIVNKLIVQGVALDTDLWVLGHTSSVQNIVHSGNDLPGTTGLSRFLAAGWLEYFAGSIGQPRGIRGNGSPSGVVTAPKACDYQRADGAAGTLKYVNTDGATAWTAYA